MMDTIPGHLSPLLRRPEPIVAICPLPLIGEHGTTGNGQIPFEADEVERLVRGTGIYAEGALYFFYMDKDVLIMVTPTGQRRQHH
jgi:hypothetical protein